MPAGSRGWSGTAPRARLGPVAGNRELETSRSCSNLHSRLADRSDKNVACALPYLEPSRAEDEAARSRRWHALQEGLQLLKDCGGSCDDAVALEQRITHQVLIDASARCLDDRDGTQAVPRVHVRLDVTEKSPGCDIGQAQSAGAVPKEHSLLLQELRQGAEQEGAGGAWGKTDADQARREVLSRMRSDGPAIDSRRETLPTSEELIARWVIDQAEFKLSVQHVGDGNAPAGHAAQERLSPIDRIDDPHTTPSLDSGIPAFFTEKCVFRKVLREGVPDEELRIED